MQGFIEQRVPCVGDHGNLVLATVGDRSCHASWLAGPGRRPFDVMLVHFGADAACDFHGAEYVGRRRGFKYELLADVVDAHRDLLARYDRVWCPDDDIRASPAVIGRLFAVFRDLGFPLAQPAVAAGEASYPVLRQLAGTSYRITPFVEMMCPVFTREAFLRTATLFRETKSGWGIDCVWSTWFQPGRMAIIDEAGVEHTGRLGRGQLYRSLEAIGIDPGIECEAMVARHGGIDRRTRRRLARGRIRLPRVPLVAAPAAAGSLLGRVSDAVRRAVRRFPASRALSAAHCGDESRPTRSSPAPCGGGTKAAA